eukprot:355073-Chlamydomonas_euryale.AAC.2
MIETLSRTVGLPLRGSTFGLPPGLASTDLIGLRPYPTWCTYHVRRGSRVPSASGIRLVAHGAWGTYKEENHRHQVSCRGWR